MSNSDDTFSKTVIASEAKQSSFLVCCAMDCFAALAMTAGYSFAISPHVSREVWSARSALMSQRAQGKPGARCTRGLACKIVQRSAHEHTGSAEAVRPSLRNGFNGFLRTLPGDRAFLSPSSVKTCFHELDASVEAPGPHDFAVRLTRRSSKAHPRPPH